MGMERLEETSPSEAIERLRGLCRLVASCQAKAFHCVFVLPFGDPLCPDCFKTLHCLDCGILRILNCLSSLI